MAELVPVKVVDGVQIYMDPDDGVFLAAPGCTCAEDGDRVPRRHHRYYCRAKTINRKALRDVEKELLKPVGKPVPIDGIHVDLWNGSKKVQVISVEPTREYMLPRFRDADGDLFNAGTDVRVYSPEAMRKLEEAHTALQAAREAYEALTKDLELLPKLTREKCRELQGAQQSQKES